MEKYFKIGVVTGTHGIKGTFKVFPTTEDPKKFEKLKTVILEHNNKHEVVHVQKVAYSKKLVLLTVKEINDINVAELYKQDRILIPKEDAVPLEEDEYYVGDLYGLNVFTDDGEDLGELVHIYETGANDVYAVKKPEDKKELLIPAIKNCILSVDIKGGKMVVHLLEGLR